MSIYEIGLRELQEYKNETVGVMKKYQEVGETILADLVKNQIRKIDSQIEYLKSILGE